MVKMRPHAPRNTIIALLRVDQRTRQLLDALRAVKACSEALKGLLHRHADGTDERYWVEWDAAISAQHIETEPATEWWQLGEDMEANLEVAVHYAVHEMLSSLQGQGLFGGDQQQCLRAFNAITVEIGRRQSTLGVSDGQANSLK